MHTRERKIIHRSQFENYIFMHFCHQEFLRINDCSSAVNDQQREWSKVKRGIKHCRKIMFFSKKKKTLISEEGPQQEIVTAGTRRSTTSQREVPQIHTPRRSIVHHTQKQQYVCLIGGSRVWLSKDLIACSFLLCLCLCLCLCLFIHKSSNMFFLKSLSG